MKDGNMKDSQTPLVIVTDESPKKLTFNCPLLDLKIKYASNNITVDTNFTQIMYENLTQLSCQNFPDIIDFYNYASPIENKNVFYGVSEGNQSPFYCNYYQENNCKYFANMSSNVMKFFLPSFEYLILNDFVNPNYDVVDVTDTETLMFFFFTCFYCTNETNAFKTEYYPNFIAQSNVTEVKNSHWILKGEAYSLPFYYVTTFVSHCNNLKDLNENSNFLYARDSCNDGKTTLFQISNSKALLIIELILFTFQCLISFFLVTVPIFYGWIKRWNFNKVDVNKTLKIWRIVTDTRMTATSYLQLSNLFLVIVSSKVIGDTNLIYNFDDNNLTLLLVVFELSVMANVPILAMFIDTLRKTEKNEKETSIGLGVLSLRVSKLFRPVFFIISVGFVGLLIFGLGLYSFKIYFQLKKYSNLNFFQFRFSRYLIMLVFIFFGGVVIVGFEISMAIYGSAPTLEFELLRFRIYAYLGGIFNWCILYMLFGLKGLICYCEILLHLIIRPFHLSDTKIGQKIISLTTKK
ncbi:hypothetical protein ABK040_003507 [Willaertia magna]